MPIAALLPVVLGSKPVTTNKRKCGWPAYMHLLTMLLTLLRPMNPHLNSAHLSQYYTLLQRTCEPRLITPPPTQSSFVICDWVDAPATPAPTVPETCSMDSRVAILGANGTGKSTLLHLITGVLQPCEGTISKHSNLKLAKYSQHSADQLPYDKSPLEYMESLYREKYPDKETMVSVVFI